MIICKKVVTTTTTTTSRKRKHSFMDRSAKVPKQTNLTDDVHSVQNRQSSALLSSLKHIRIFAIRHPKPACVTKENWLVFNVTSTTKEQWCKEFSPFYLGPIELYPNETDGKMYIAKNMENAWQFAKVYKNFANPDDSPSDEYWKWAQQGWNDSQAHRFPLGRQAGKPLYSLWNGERLNYIEARKRIYAPLYAKYVEQTDAYKKLSEIYSKYCCGDKNSKEARPMVLVDFDGWDHLGQGYRLEQVIDISKPKMGHAFVIAGLLENNLFWLNEPQKSQFEQQRSTGRLLKDIF